MRNRRNMWPVVACLVVLGLAAAAYILVFLPKKNEDALRAICNGAAETRYVSRILDSEDLSAAPEDSGGTGSSSGLAECGIEAPGSGIRVEYQIGDESDAPQILREMRHA